MRGVERRHAGLDTLMGRLSQLLHREPAPTSSPDVEASGEDMGQDPASRGKRARQANQERPHGGRLTRLIHKVAGIVFPTNKSGNNMSVR